MNEYFTGFEFGKSDHLPIDFVELPLCQSTMPAKNKEEATFGTFFLQSCATLFFSLSSQWSHFIHVHVVCLRFRIGH